MPDEVTLGELARGIADIKRRLDTDAQAAATRERLYVLQAVYDEFKSGQAEKFKTLQESVTDLWEARAEDAKARRSTQLAIALALLADVVMIVIAFIGYLKR